MGSALESASFLLPRSSTGSLSCSAETSEFDRFVLVGEMLSIQWDYPSLFVIDSSPIFVKAHFGVQLLGVFLKQIF